jgi:hypothetical protein
MRTEVKTLTLDGLTVMEMRNQNIVAMKAAPKESSRSPMNGRA